MLKHGVESLSYWVNYLVDKGYKEDIDVIEKEFENSNLVQYLNNKYGEEIDLSCFREDGPYSSKDVNYLFNEMSDYVRGNESRKFCVENNGLCLINALCFYFLSRGIDEK